MPFDKNLADDYDEMIRRNKAAMRQHMLTIVPVETWSDRFFDFTVIEINQAINLLVDYFVDECFWTELPDNQIQHIGGRISQNVSVMRAIRLNG